jgi:hypothetical protein
MVAVGERIVLRRVKYLNNIIEQDEGALFTLLQVISSRLTRECLNHSR